MGEFVSEKLGLIGFLVSIVGVFFVLVSEQVNS